MVNMSIDDLVDKVLAKHINEDDEVKKDTTEPKKDIAESKKDINKPFRYITTEEEIQQELGMEESAPVSVMDLSEKKAMFDIDQGIFTLALGDTDRIESVLKKHKDIRKNRLD